MSESSRFWADANIPYCSMEVAESFSLLTEKEKLYTYWISKASWAGVPIIQDQWTQYSQELFKLLLTIFGSSTSSSSFADLPALRSKLGSSISDEEWSWALEYTAQATSNLSNYKSFGFSKFIPRISKEKFRKIVEHSERSSEALKTWDKLEAHIYATTPEAEMLLGKPNAGHISNYYLGELIQDEDVAAVQSGIEKYNIAVENTRVRKNGPNDFTVLIASSNTGAAPASVTHAHTHEGKEVKITLQYGDFAQEMKNAAAALTEAKKYAANENQEKMLEEYIKSFETGDMEHYKEGSRWWVKDVGPVVESYLGFVETYVDPYGGRAEWEGFTAIVNKKLTEKYDKLVGDAPELIKTLPWGPKFEVDVFRKPDFTALEVVNFATGGIPAGINIPKYVPQYFSARGRVLIVSFALSSYFDIRESLGFKNVSLANILAAKAPADDLPFIHPKDKDLFRAWDTRAFELQVANHELLGHGSGKLFTEDAKGVLNFDPATTINPLTGKPVTTWYKSGQTPGSVLGTVSSSMEECRAESVAMYLVGNRDILKIFNYTSEQDIEEMQYISFLLMARAGLRALEFYDPAAKKHLQAHMQARMGINNFFIKEGLAHLEEIRENGKLVDAYIHVDRQKVLTIGQQTMSKLLLELQVRKSTADGEGARQYYTELTNPLPGWEGELRDLVISKKQPRKVFVQPNLVLKDGKVELKEYELSAAGAVQSFVEREIY
ncbi:aflatoxin-detoxifizyme [Clavulina sp. PMI_390]|nr:aflatoxin-detoxifizyme [Clavulina sp. PMI_390]